MLQQLKRLQLHKQQHQDKNMAIPATKTEFGNWCKRKLGYPVIDINVDADQVDDRVDEAIQYYQMYMGGGNRRMYLKHQ